MTRPYPPGHVAISDQQLAELAELAHRPNTSVAIAVYEDQDRQCGQTDCHQPAAERVYFPYREPDENTWRVCEHHRHTLMTAFLTALDIKPEAIPPGAEPTQMVVTTEADRTTVDIRCVAGGRRPNGGATP